MKRKINLNIKTKTKILPFKKNWKNFKTAKIFHV